jgi:hypothetical protein
VPFTPALSTHVALANDAALVDADLTVVACAAGAGTVVSNVQLLEESTALKYLGGSAIVINPPMGTTVAVVNLKSISPLLGLPGANVPPIARIRVTAPPIARVLGSNANAALLSVEVATLYVLAA